MVSAAKYLDLVEKFIAKYGTVLSTTIKKDMLDIAEWALGFSAAMAKDQSAQSKLTYMKRGANLMKRFITQYEKDKSDMDSKLLQCREALLGVPGVVLPSWCTEATKNKLLKFGVDLRVFTSELIGCADAGNDFFLAALKRSANFLGEDYVKIKDSIELTCIHLRILELKR